MKSSFARSLAVIALVVPFAPCAWAGSKVGNGGYGVRIGERIFNLDLAMRHVHLQPVLSENEALRLTAEQLQIMNYHFSEILHPAVLSHVVKKLSLLDRLTSLANRPGSVMSLSRLTRGVDRFRWLYLNDLKCLDVGDDPSPFPNKVQLAYRKDMWVRLCRDFGQLDDANQAALVLHEIIYAQLPDDRQPLVPQLVGFLFSEDAERWDQNAQEEFNFIFNGIEGGGPIGRETFYDTVRNKFLGTEVQSSDAIRVEAIWRGWCVSPYRPDHKMYAEILMYPFSHPFAGEKTSLYMWSSQSDYQSIEEGFRVFDPIKETNHFRKLWGGNKRILDETAMRSEVFNNFFQLSSSEKVMLKNAQFHVETIGESASANFFLEVSNDINWQPNYGEAVYCYFLGKDRFSIE